MTLTALEGMVREKVVVAAVGTLVGERCRVELMGVQRGIRGAPQDW